MKTCGICGHESPDTAPTCPRCGEASWLDSRPAHSEPERESAHEHNPTAADRPRRRRS